MAFTQCQYIVPFGNNTKHSNGLKLNVNVVLKPGRAFGKSQNENRKGFGISKLRTLFTGSKKLW